MTTPARYDDINIEIGAHTYGRCAYIVNPLVWVLRIKSTLILFQLTVYT